MSNTEIVFLPRHADYSSDRSAVTHSLGEPVLPALLSVVQTRGPAAITVVGRSGAPRPLWPAILRGLRCRCPACGQGRLFERFLKPVENCQVCGENYTAQRADDFPPYLVILLLGHILIPAIVLFDHAFAPPLWIYMTFGSIFVAMLAAAMLQPAKGAVIACQWAFRMQGFGTNGV